MDDDLIRCIDCESCIDGRCEFCNGAEIEDVNEEIVCMYFSRKEDNIKARINRNEAEASQQKQVDYLMSLWSEEAIEQYNKDKIRKMRDTNEQLNTKAEHCDIKNPIINNGYHVCTCEMYC